MKIYRLSNSDSDLPPMYLKDKDGRNIAINPEYLEKIKVKRTNDVRELLMTSNMPLSTLEIISKLSDKFPDRWTSYYKDARRMTSCLLSIINSLKDNINISTRTSRSVLRGLGKFKTVNLYAWKR